MTKHLRLVHPAKPTVRKPRPRLTSEQRERLGTVIRNLHSIYGRWRVVANEMGMSEAALHRVVAGKAGSMAMVVRAAELANMSVERLLSGEISAADNCPRCGQKVGG